MTAHTHESDQATDWIGAASAGLPSAGGATLVGRVFESAAGGPTPVLVEDGEVYALTPSFATVSDLTEQPDPAKAAREAKGTRLGSFAEIHANSQHGRRDPAIPWLLAPHDLHAVKAAGVTFAVSMVERVIEERAGGDQEQAAALRKEITEQIGGDLRSLRPGSLRATELKSYLVERGMWSQYLEVGIGPDAEIFSKALPLASVGVGAEIGVLAASNWNNPEPEAVLVVSSDGRIVGATLGNDVNLRDIEGRSALLLPKAKDNNASSATGPLIRLFDAGFTLDDVRSMEVRLTVRGEDGYELEAASDMSQISRDPESLVAQLIGRHHQYPDGALLFLGTLFAPVDDRGEAGKGFTHQVGDVVEIHSPLIGTLINRVQLSEECTPWTFGLSDLMRNLAGRGLL
ncbi:fumarylacetoacetate hydrolase family protein [Leucobacter sp. W1153]|uniref:fumarylacetoacetate hydrolase family protein n=1 Tax=Leucobacter sp. W1153 TaxID=3439064 RepID=UPI003F326E93